MIHHPMNGLRGGKYKWLEWSLWIAHCTPAPPLPSSIHLASSLTIESISKNNGSGGNHGGKGTIKTL